MRATNGSLAWQRSAGAANPLVQDVLWKADPYKASHCNLQALREMDARAGASFLCTGSRGDYRLLIGSPDYDSLSQLVAEQEAHCGGAQPPPAERAPPASRQTDWFF